MNILENKVIKDLIIETMSYRIVSEEQNLRTVSEEVFEPINEVDNSNSSFDILAANNVIRKVENGEAIPNIDEELIYESIRLYQHDLSESTFQNLVLYETNSCINSSTIEKIYHLDLLKNILKFKKEFYKRPSKFKKNEIEKIINIFNILSFTIDQQNKNLPLNKLKSVVDEKYIKLQALKSIKTFKRKEIVLVEFGDGIGTEFGYKHYCIIIKNLFNRIIVLPITSTKKKYYDEFNHDLFKSEIPKLSKDSRVLIDQVQSISKDRILYRTNIVIPDDVMDCIDSKLENLLFQKKSNND